MVTVQNGTVITPGFSIVACWLVSGPKGLSLFLPLFQHHLSIV